MKIIDSKFMENYALYGAGILCHFSLGVPTEYTTQNPSQQNVYSKQYS